MKFYGIVSAAEQKMSEYNYIDKKMSPFQGTFLIIIPLVAFFRASPPQ